MPDSSLRVQLIAGPQRSAKQKERFPGSQSRGRQRDNNHSMKVGKQWLCKSNYLKPVFRVLTSALKGLGQRHVNYGVRPEHYPIVGAVLLETFADVLGERWTPAYHDAWAQAYETVCAIMLEGANVPTPA